MSTIETETQAERPSCEEGLTPNTARSTLPSEAEGCFLKLFNSGSFTGSVVTTVETVGVGLLSVLYAVNLTGLLLGCVVVIVGMVLSFYTCRLLILCAQQSGKDTYDGIGVSAWGVS